MLEETIKNATRSFGDWWHGLNGYQKALVLIPAIGAAATATAATTAGVAYLISPKKTKRFFADRLYEILTGAEKASRTIAAKVPKTSVGNVHLAGSVSATGPGVLLRYGDFPLRLKGDFGGGGIMYGFTRADVLKAMKRLGIKNKYRRRIKKLAPPNMYTGLELSPFPVAFGLEIDSSNAHEVAEKLRLLRDVLRPHTRYAFNKKEYKKDEIDNEVKKGPEA